MTDHLDARRMLHRPEHRQDGDEGDGGKRNSDELGADDAGQYGQKTGHC